MCTAGAPCTEATIPKIMEKNNLEAARHINSEVKCPRCRPPYFGTLIKDISMVPLNWRSYNIGVDYIISLAMFMQLKFTVESNCKAKCINFADSLKNGAVLQYVKTEVKNFLDFLADRDTALFSKDWNDLPLNFYSIPTVSIFNSTINAQT